ncbi:MAG: ABC transporter ATP-binding protein [Oscillibacter sp.]|nr:ABC transporter ATP-binding protein [Oscillibacter sp.]
MAALEIENLSFAYRNHPPLFRGLSLRADETVGLIGANGAGKSTLLKLLVGLEEGYGGSVRVQGREARGKGLEEIRKRTGYVFQDSESQLFLRTVREDVAFGPRNQGRPDWERVTAESLERTGLGGLGNRNVYQLSGGEKKLAAIAGVLAMGAEMMLLDEPSAALDPANRERLIAILNALPGVKLIASHDLDFIYDTCKRVILLSHGEIAGDGPAEEILRNRALLEANELRLPLSFRFGAESRGNCRGGTEHGNA